LGKLPRTVRVSAETHRRLVRLAGRLQAEHGRSLTMNDVIEWLLDRAEGKGEPK